ncbi:MAG: hypothetical protein QGF59_15575, partial [Pirellulaceae bacterium]|nr:hypothetical protein [Pirellulaceae bacterium]
MIRVHSHSEPGGHVVNEDAYRVVQHEGDDRCHMIVVADGQGGRSGGAAAAATACNSFIDQANAIRPKDLLLLSRWDELLGSVDLSVVQDPAAGYTTLVALCVFEGFLVGASSGDSAAMIHLPNEDRYFVLTERQQKNPPVGSGSAVF